MAIQIGNTTVLTDSCQLVNTGVTVTNNSLQKPVILSPLDGELELDVYTESFTIVGGEYNSVFPGGQSYREFQIALANTDFANVVFSQQLFNLGNTDTSSLTIDPFTFGEDALDDGLAVFGQEFEIRIRDVDIEGNASDWSDPVSYKNGEFTFPLPGQPYCGGLYMGGICAAGQCYALIVAPNSTGCASCILKTSESITSGTDSFVDGYNNTYGPMDNASHPAANWCATRTINGFSDWYLPARDEMQTFYDNGADGTSGSVNLEGERFVRSHYWSSSESNATYGCIFCFDCGTPTICRKTSSSRVRAVRREPI